MNMNRKHGQSQRIHDKQSQMRRNRPQNQNFDSDFDQRGSRSHDVGSSHDTYETGRGYRDTDYNMDIATYQTQRLSNQNRVPMSYNADSAYGDFDTNDRNRQPSRFSSLDEDSRSPANRSSYDASYESYFGSQGDRGLNRQDSSSERFGYPSNMNAWNANDRAFNPDRAAGKTGQSSWGAQDKDTDSWGYSSSQAYGEGSLGNEWKGSQSSSRNYFGKGPKGYKRSDDRIKEEVCETLARNPRIDASDIEVNVDNAMVTLSGTVDSKEIRRAAEIAIENLSGVDDVKNEIKVKKFDLSPTMNETSSTYGSQTTAKKGASRV